MKKIAVSLHDVRVSENEETIKKILIVMERFGAPITVHLVFDQPLKKYPLLNEFLLEQVKSGQLELVFHGLTHACSKKVGRWCSFYHKYQAEYLVDSETHRLDSGKTYEEIANDFHSRIGICPPCWLSHKNNNKYFQSLNPDYIESMSALRFGEKKIFSPIISIGSSKAKEIFFLKIGAQLTFFLSLILPTSRVRMAIHVCDIPIDSTILFFQKLHTKLIRRGFEQVFQRQLSPSP